MTPLILYCKGYSQKHKKNDGAEKDKQEIIHGTKITGCTSRR